MSAAKVPPHSMKAMSPSIEPLETRIAPATFLVTTLSDLTADDVDLTLREAVAAANATPAADSIKFDPSLTGAITLTAGEILISETLTIVGGGKITISGDNASRIFNVANADTVKDHPLTVNGLKFIRGDAGVDGGGAIFSTEGLTILSCIFADNSADGRGGAVRVSAALGSLIVKDSHFSGNTSADNGGGLFAVTQKAVTISGSFFDGNAGSSGGGAFVGLETDSGKITISKSIFSDNTATGRGGGLVLTIGSSDEKSSKASVADSSFIGNTAGTSGGGVEIDQGVISLSGVKIVGNTANHGGGGIDTGSGVSQFTLTKSLVEGNTAVGNIGGGGIVFGGGAPGFSATISNSQIVGNKVENAGVPSGPGGGILAEETGGKITVTNSLISGNTAARGGGMAVFQTAEPNVIVTLTGNTISGNETSGNGAGLLLFRYGDFFLTKNAIVDNHAMSGAGAGGLEFDVVGKIALKANQIVGNVSAGGTGGLRLVMGNESSFTDSGNVIAHNEGGGTGGLAISSSVPVTIGKSTKITGNIAGTATAGGGVTNESGTVNLPGVVLGNYNRADSAFNQTRGTFATGPAPVPSVAANLIVTNLGGSGPGSLRAMIDLANTTPGADKIKFDDALEGVINVSQLDVTDTLTIYGRGKITISGGGNARIFNVSNPDTEKDHPLTLSGLTLVKGKTTGLLNPGGAAILSSEGLTILDCLFADNSAGSNGGAIFVDSTTGALTIKNSHFADNSAAVIGGGVYANVPKTIAISSNVFQGNSSGVGGGAALLLKDAVGKMTLSGSHFVGNVASGGGAGILIEGVIEGTKSTKMAVSNSTFAGNAAGGAGGGLYLAGGGFTLTNVNLTGNAAGAEGGGLVTGDGLRQLAVAKSLFTANTASSALGGGGAYLGPGATGFVASFSATSFLGNSATAANASGGGLFADSIAGKLTVTASLFAGNDSKVGGGLAATGTGSSAPIVALTGNTFTGNTATTGGGISLLSDAALTLGKNAIVANEATTEAGGAWLASKGKIALSGNSILGNGGGTGVGGLLLRGVNTPGVVSTSFTTAGDIIAFNEGATGGLEIEEAIAGIIAKSVKITANVGSGALKAGGITQESANTNGIELQSVVLGNLHRTDPAKNEIFGLFAS